MAADLSNYICKISCVYTYLLHTRLCIGGLVKYVVNQRNK